MEGGRKRRRVRREWGRGNKQQRNQKYFVVSVAMAIALIVSIGIKAVSLICMFSV